MRLFDVLAGWYDGFMSLAGLANERVLAGFISDAAGRDVADIGGGTGSLAALLAAGGAKVTIIDPSAPMTDIARKKHPGIQVINAPAEEMPVASSSFDIVCMKDCLHHIERQEAALAEAVRILRPGGVMVIQDFYPESPLATIIYLLERALGERTTLVSPRRLAAMLEKLSVEGKYIWSAGWSIFSEGTSMGVGELCYKVVREARVKFV